MRKGGGGVAPSYDRRRSASALQSARFVDRRAFAGTLPPQSARFVDRRAVAGASPPQSRRFVDRWELRAWGTGDLLGKARPAPMPMGLVPVCPAQSRRFVDKRVAAGAPPLQTRQFVSKRLASSAPTPQLGRFRGSWVPRSLACLAPIRLVQRGLNGHAHGARAGVHDGVRSSRPRLRRRRRTCPEDLSV